MHDLWKTHRFQIREFNELMGLAEVNTFLLMRANGIGQVRQKHCRSLLAKDLLENPWIMAELETERREALRLRPLIVVMGALGGGSANRSVALEKVKRTNGKDIKVRNVTQWHHGMCVKK
eukprot:scaffold83_cov390-Pavlova_lutheri.AAC.4